MGLPGIKRVLSSEEHQIIQSINVLGMALAQCFLQQHSNTLMLMRWRDSFQKNANEEQIFERRSHVGKHDVAIPLMGSLQLCLSAHGGPFAERMETRKMGVA